MGTCRMLWPAVALVAVAAPLAAHVEPDCPTDHVVISVAFHPRDDVLKAAAPELRRSVFEYLAHRVVSRGRHEDCMVSLVDQRKLEDLAPRIAHDVVWIHASIDVNQIHEEIGFVNYTITVSVETPGVASNWAHRRAHLFRRASGAAAFSGDLLAEALDGLQLGAPRVESKPGLADMDTEILRRMRP